MKSLAKVLLSLGLGLAWWYGISYTIAAMSGAGHGWFGAVASIGSVFFLPLTGVGFLFRPAPWVRFVSLYVTVGCLLLDFIIGATIYSPGGRDGLGRVHEHAPEVLYAWEALWLLWHAAIVALWVRLLWRAEPNAGLATPQSNSGGQGEPPSMS